MNSQRCLRVSVKERRTSVSRNPNFGRSSLALLRHIIAIAAGVAPMRLVPPDLPAVGRSSPALRYERRRNRSLRFRILRDQGPDRSDSGRGGGRRRGSGTKLRVRRGRRCAGVCRRAATCPARTPRNLARAAYRARDVGTRAGRETPQSESTERARGVGCSRCPRGGGSPGRGWMGELFDGDLRRALDS